MSPNGTPPAQLVEDHGGVEVRKSLEEETYEFPSIEYQLVSNRDEEVEITIRDPIPEAIEISNIGFHREYGKDHWDIDREELVFEYTLEPYEDFLTVYAFRAESVELSEDILLPPETVEVEPDAETVPDSEPIKRSGADMPYQPGSEPEDTQPAGGVDIEREEADLESSEESLIDRLAAELERPEKASEESLQKLESHFGGSASSGSLEARLEQVQEDVTNLRAYTGALEEFLDEEGSAQEIIESFESQMADMEAELEELGATTAQLERSLETIETEVRDVDSSVESMSSDLQDLESAVNAVQDDVGSLENRVPSYSVDERFADLEDDLESISGFVENLKRAFE